MAVFLQDLLQRVQNQRLKIYSLGAFAQGDATTDS